MIDPLKVTDYARSDRDLEEFWLFCICVAGKNSDYASRAIGRVVRGIEGPIFHYFRVNPHLIHNILVTAATGQYGRIEAAIRDTAEVAEEMDVATWLRTASVGDLESIHGVGPKTARFFILHTRPGARVAVLDTHVMAYLRDRQATTALRPTPAKYAQLEGACLALYELDFPGLTPAEVDLLVWARYSGRLD